MPQISVIVPVYNTEEYLPRCIESILGQSFADFELLLIDDGSTDGSAAICDRYAEKDSRVRVFHKENGGVSSARNVGLRNVNGKYVCFADADDWVNERYLEHLMQGEDDSDLVIAGSQYFGLMLTSIIPNAKKMEAIESFFSEFEKYGLILGHVVAKRFNNSIICKHGISFQENLFYCEDISFLLKYIFFVSKYMEVPFADYQIRCSSVSVGRDRKYKMSAQQFVVHFNSFAECFDKIRKWNSAQLLWEELNLILFRKFIAYLQECDSVREYWINSVCFRNQKFAKSILGLLKGKREKRIGYGVYYCPVVSFYFEKLAELYRKIH